MTSWVKVNEIAAQAIGDAITITEYHIEETKKLHPNNFQRGRLRGLQNLLSNLREQQTVHNMVILMHRKWGISEYGLRQAVDSNRSVQ